MATMTKFSLDDFLARPDTKPASEYVYGKVIQKPTPDDYHSKIQGFLYLVIHQFTAGSGIGQVSIELRCVCGSPGEEHAYVPDLVFAAQERRAVRGRSPCKFLWTAPDLVIDVLSPAQPAGRFPDKIEYYVRHGVRLIWVFDPEEHRFEYFVPAPMRERCIQGTRSTAKMSCPAFVSPLTKS